MREMGQNHKSVAVLQIWLNLWWMILLGVRHNYTKSEQRWQPGTGATSGGPMFHNLPELAKNAIFFWLVWVPRMSMEGAICIGTNPDDEQTPLITIGWVLHPISGLNDLFLGPKYGKVLVEKAPSLHILVMCLTTMDCVGNSCGDEQ